MSLRIGIFVMTFPQVSETFIVTKILKLIEHGFDVQIYTLAPSQAWDSFRILDGRDDVRARVHVVPPLHPWSQVMTAGALELARIGLSHPAAFSKHVAHSWRQRNHNRSGFLKSLYARSNFIGRELDILHIEFDAQAVGIAELKEVLGCRILLSSRGTLQQLSLLDTNSEACSYLFRYADGYHFISKFLEHNTRALGLPADIPTWQIAPAIDLQLFRPQPRSTASSLRVISVGRLSWEKGHELAIDAMAHVRAAGVDTSYEIFGAGPHEDAIRYAIHQHRLEGSVHLMGAKSREEMPKAYQRADIMLHAAVAEGFCNAVIEAQAMELPVVSSDAGGLPENVEQNVTGFIVPRREPIAMARRVVELANSPELRRMYGRQGRERALTKFDLDRQAEAFVTLYRDLCKRPVRPIQDA